VERQAGIPDLVDILSERIPPTDLQSLLMEVYRRRAAQTSPAGLLDRYAENRFTRPSLLDPASVAAIEHRAWSLLPDGYQALELSPICPLGTSAVVATVDQNKVVSTVRNTEVVSDSSNVLALEGALRRRSLGRDPRSRFEPVRLAASQRQVRAQAFGGPGEWAHFRILALVAAGRDAGTLAFEEKELRSQIGYLIALIGATRPEWQVEVALTDLAGHTQLLQERVLDPMAARFPDAVFRMDPSREAGRGYYVDACYKVFAVTTSLQRRELGDGGCTTWTRQLLSDDKERLVIAGLGLERLLA
jgi:hypothetical protein